MRLNRVKYKAFTSGHVIREFQKAPVEKKELMLDLIKQFGIDVLENSDEAEKLAEIYIREGIIPHRFKTDGIHIATATVNDLDMILSLNFKHIVKKKTIELTEFVNLREGNKKCQI